VHEVRLVVAERVELDDRPAAEATDDTLAERASR